MNIMSLINALPGAAAQGLIWGIMAIGVYLTFRILDVADLTVDGTMCTGGAVCVMMLMSGHNIWVSMLAATGAGMLAGLATGIFHTFMGIPAILAGILTQLGLYSANLKIMGKANQAVNGNKYDLLVSLQGADERAIWHFEIIDIMGVVLLPLRPEINDLDIANPALRCIAGSFDLFRQIKNIAHHFIGLAYRHIGHIQPEQRRCRAERRAARNADTVNQVELFLAGVQPETTSDHLRIE